MPPRNRQRNVQDRPLPEAPVATINDDKTKDDDDKAPATPEKAPEAVQTALDGPESPVQTFQAPTEQDAVAARVSPLAAPPRMTVPQRTYENKPSAGGGNARPVGRILGMGEPFTFEGVRSGDNVMLTENVYREVYYPGTKRPSFILVATRGQVLKVQNLINLSEQMSGV